jgi:hypothetical protein
MEPDQHVWRSRQLQQEYDRLEEERKTNNLLSNLLGMPGFILAGIGNILLMGNTTPDNPSYSTIGMLIGFVGSALLCLGLSFYARYKGRNPWLGLWGLLGIFGVIILGCLRDENHDRMRQIELLRMALGENRGPAYAWPQQHPHTEPIRYEPFPQMPGYGAYAVS